MAKRLSGRRCLISADAALGRLLRLRLVDGVGSGYCGWPGTIR